MLKELVERYIKACEEMEESTGLIAFSDILQCTTEGFFKLIDMYDVTVKTENVEYGKYPYKAEAIIEGYKFFTLLDKEEYEKYLKGVVA